VRKNEKTKLFANFFEHKTNELKNDVFSLIGIALIHLL
jgi:hypothetical protein